MPYNSSHHPPHVFITLRLVYSWSIDMSADSPSDVMNILLSSDIKLVVVVMKKNQLKKDRLHDTTARCSKKHSCCILTLINQMYL